MPKYDFDKEGMLPPGDPASSSTVPPKAVPFQVSQDPVSFGEAGQTSTAVAPAYDDLGELPSHYGTKFVFLVARDPYWLFAYWDFDWSQIPESADGETHLKVYHADGTLESDIAIHRHTQNWYIPVKASGKEYYVDIGVTTAAGEWLVVARSGLATTPSDRLSPSTESQFATLPFHLGFQKLVDVIKAAMQEGESLLQTLARMQREGQALGFETGKAPLWTEEQRSILEMLLGKEVVDALLAGASSGELDVLLKKYLEENLHSESASEMALRGRFSEILGVPESSLFSGIGASWFGRQLVSGAGGSETVGGSWQIGAGASWQKGVGMTGSWQVGAQAAWQQALSSWGAAASWQSGIGASWFSGLTSSFETGVGASWQSAVGASWSAQPFSQQQRGFFMHVNAEVIFYGGTDPNATVWIDGKQIKLQPDGTFRYHFIFPDKDYEIPIVAQSPDGLEFRTAILKFTRRTDRVGDVGATGQPDLGKPMGEK